MNLRFVDYVKLILLVFALFIILRFLGEIARVLLFFALVIILAMMLTPLVSWVERHRVPRTFGALLIVLLIFLLLGVVGFLFIPPLLEQTASFIANIPVYWAQATAWLQGVTAQFPALQRFIAVDEQILGTIIERAEDLLLQVGALTLGLLSAVAAAVLVFVMTVFTLIQPRPLLIGLFSMVPEEARARVAQALHTTAQQMRAWVTSSMLVGLVNGTIVWIGLSLLGVEPAFLLAMLVFFGEFFPYIGPIAAAIPAILLAFLVSPLTALWTLLLYVGIQQLEASVLSPLILARRMKFHPISVAFAIIALGELYGILGAFLAVPALAAVKAFYNELVLKPRGVDEKQMEELADVVVESHRIERNHNGEARPPPDQAV